MKGDYKFLKDKLFIISVILYLINSLTIRMGINNNYFMRNYFNDLLLIPVALPIVLYLIKLFKFRNDNYPSFSEIFICLIVWSIMFEFVGPKIMNKGTADIYDVLAYSVGAIISYAIWRIQVLRKSKI